ncbi:hypothetical protein [Vibrio harveyi]|uniref:hypothetical protein n=1 Tax=Vibrio harveyi TaxID=669 RepID=UPI003D72D73D
MHPLQNGSQVTERPANKPVSGLPGYFTESGENNVPSYPGADWFNHVIDEFLNLINEAGVAFDPQSDSNLAKAIRNRKTESYEYISSVDGNVKEGQLISVQDYGPGHNSGRLYFKVVAGGTGVHDGGKYIDLPNSGLQLEQNLKKPYNASSWGQVGNLIADDTQAVANALIYARNTGRLVINGKSLMTSPLVFGVDDRGMFIEGDGSQSYGEFNTGKSSTLFFSGLSDGEWCVTLNSIFPFRFDGINIESDNWNSNGLKTTAPSRELIFNDFSIKGVANGIETHDTFVVRGENIGITARNTAISWGGGTTLQLENLKLQGDKAGGVRLKKGIAFTYDPAQSDSPAMPNVRVSGFCQYVDDVVDTDGSSVQLELDAFDVEDVGGSILKIKNQYKGSYRIKNSALLLNDGANVLDIGGGNQHVTIDISTPLMKDKHMITRDWSTEKFVKCSGPLSNIFEIVLDEKLFSIVKDGIDDDARPNVKAVRAPFVTTPDCILHIGSGRMPEDDVTLLWRNMQLYDVVNNDILYYGTKSSEFSNGMIYKITSQDASNSPIVAYFTMRTADGSQYFNKTDVVGSVPLTYDSLTKELVFSATFSNQRFVITAG